MKENTFWKKKEIISMVQKNIIFSESNLMYSNFILNNNTVQSLSLHYFWGNHVTSEPCYNYTDNVTKES